MRRFVTLALVRLGAGLVGLGAVLGLGACTASGTRTPCATQDWPALRIAIANPGGYKVGWHGYNFPPGRVTTQSLIDADSTGRPRPGMAREWQTRDRQTWTITLRDDVRTHNGTPITAEFMRRVLLRRIAQQPKGTPVWRDLESIETPAPLTMVFRFKGPVSTLVEHLELLERSNDDPDALNAGPWRITHETDDRMDLEVSPMPPAGAARLRTIRVDFYPSARVAYAALMRHDADFMQDVPAATLPSLTQNPEIRIYGSELRRVGTFAFNLKSPALRDVRVRQAINLAIDRDELVRQLYGGHPALMRIMKPVMGPFSPDYWALEGLASPWHYDLAAARALLKEATGGREEPIELRCMVGNEYPEWALLTSLLERQLQRVRIHLRLEPLPVRDMVPRIEAGTFDTLVSPINVSGGSALPYLFYHSGGLAAGMWRDSGYSTADAAFDRLYAADSDDKERAAGRDVIHAMYTDPPAAFLIPQMYIRAVRNTWHVPDDEIDIRRTFARWRFEAPCGTR